MASQMITGLIAVGEIRLCGQVPAAGNKSRGILTFQFSCKSFAEFLCLIIIFAKSPRYLQNLHLEHEQMNSPTWAGISISRWHLESKA